MQKRQSNERCADTGKVRLGGQSPSLPVRTTDSGKVRLGGQSPSLPPRAIADSGKVRICLLYTSDAADE